MLRSRASTFIAALNARRVAHALHKLNPIRAGAQLPVDHAVQILHHQLGISGLDVDAGPHRAAANAQIAQIIGGLVHPFQIAAQGAGVRVEFLAEPDGHRILKMGAARLHYSVELPSLRRECIDKCLNRFTERRQLRNARDANGCRDHVIGRLGHVDVIIGMHGRIFPALAAEHLVSAVREHLVDVHVVRRTRASLIHVDDELVAPLSAKHFVCCCNYRIGETSVETPGFLVRERCCALDAHDGVDERGERANSAYRKVLDRAQRLHAVKCVGRYGELAEWVLLNPRCV